MLLDATCRHPLHFANKNNPEQWCLSVRQYYFLALWVSEEHAKITILLFSVSLKNSTFIRRLRVKSSLTAVKLEKLDAEKYDSVHVRVDITTQRNRKLTIGTVYRPPKLQAADDTALYDEINFITQNKKAVIIGISIVLMPIGI